MRRLIVNADDAGIDVPRNMGIAECLRRGVVTSVTVLVQAPAAADAFRRLAEFPRAGVGLHLNLSFGPGRPGKHAVWAALRAGTLDLAAAEADLQRQVEAFIAARGAPPTHFDGHNHVHVFPRVPPIVARLARRYGVRAVRLPEEPAPPPEAPLSVEERALLAECSAHARAARAVFAAAGLSTTDHFRGGAWIGRLDEAALEALIAGLPEGITELMTHPGLADPASVPFSSPAREAEMRALTAPRAFRALRAAGVDLTHFGGLDGPACG